MDRPSLSSIVTRIQSDLANHLNLTPPLKKESILSALSLALAGAVHLLYGHLEAVQSQLSVETATGASLERLALLFGVKKRGKTQAQGFVRASGASGKTIPKDALLSSSDGRIYITQSPYTIGPECFVWAEVMAQEEGKTGNIAEDESLTLVSPIAGIESKAIVLRGGIRCGFEAEDDDTLRARLLSRLKHPGQGGTKQDYIHWAQEVPGVEKVAVSSDLHSFLVLISFLTIDPEHPIPSEHLIEKVREHLLKKKPLGTSIFVSAGGLNEAP